jgi:membrane protease YdiL (CAAX protease family)
MTPRALSPGLILVVLALALVGLVAALEVQVVLRAVLASEPIAVAQQAVVRQPAALALAQLVGLGAPLLFALRLRGEPVRAFVVRALAPCPWDRVAVACVAGLALQLPLVEITHRVSVLLPGLARSPDEEARLAELMRIDSVADAIFVPLAVVVLAPLTEELLFRGLAQPDLATRMGRVSSVALVATLFSVFHLDPVSAPAIAVAGVGLGLLADRWQSVRPGLAMHAGVNALPVLLPEELVAVPGFNTAHGGALDPGLLAASGAVGLVALALAMRPEAARSTAASGSG